MLEVRTETVWVETPSIPAMEYFCSNAGLKRLNPYWVQEQSPHSLFHQWKGLKVVRSTLRVIEWADR